MRELPDHDHDGVRPAEAAREINPRGDGGPGPADGVTGTVHVIIPIDTPHGSSDQPGEVPGHGPMPASVARAIAARANGLRWCYSIADQAGHLLRHHTRPCPGGTGGEFLAEVAKHLDTHHGLPAEVGCAPGIVPAPQHAQGPTDRPIHCAT